RKFQADRAILWLDHLVDCLALPRYRSLQILNRADDRPPGRNPLDVAPLPAARRPACRPGLRHPRHNASPAAERRARCRGRGSTLSVQGCDGVDLPNICCAMRGASTSASYSGMREVGRIQKELPGYANRYGGNMRMAGEDARVELLNGLAHV